jgi:hypothetical protein
MTGARRKGKQIIVWLEDELYAEVELARGDEDRSSWIRRKLAEAIARGERPSFADAVESAPAPALSLQRQSSREAPAPVSQERKETVRW